MLGRASTWRRSQLRYVTTHDAGDAFRLLAVAKRLEPIDADLAIQTYMEALGISP